MGQAVAFTRAQRQWRIELGNHECSLVIQFNGQSPRGVPGKIESQRQSAASLAGSGAVESTLFLAYWKSFIALTSVWSTPSTSGIPTKPQARISLVFIDGS